MGNSNDNSHDGCHRHVYNDYATARVEITHRYKEKQAKRIADLCNNGNEVRFVLTHSYIVTYHFQKWLIIVAVSNGQPCNNSHCEQQATLYTSIFFQLFHFLFSFLTQNNLMVFIHEVSDCTIFLSHPKDIGKADAADAYP